MVYELTPRHHDKGEAMRRVHGCGAFNGWLPAFIGDDGTDEDGFRVTNELDGVSTCVGQEPGTTARYGLEDVAAVQAWLQSLVGKTSA